MIGKQTKGTSFGGCVSYVLKEEKARLRCGRLARTNGGAVRVTIPIE